MTHIDIKVAGAAARLVKQEGILTDGMVGATATFAFDGAWDGLSKMAVFRAGGVTRDQIMGSDTVRIPPEVLLEGKTLYVGVEGRNGDGSLVIPTVWVRAGTVYDGANASGDPSTDPTLPVWAQIVAMIGELDGLKTVDKSSLVEAINEVLSKSGGGSVDEDTIAQLVEEYLAENPPKVTETDPTVPDWAKQSTKPSYTADEVGAIPVPETATVGQTIVVKEVDEDGKPVSWECVDVAGGGEEEQWKLLIDFESAEDLAANTGMLFDTSDDGVPFNEKELIIDWYCPKTSGDSYATFRVNDKKINGGCVEKPGYFWSGILFSGSYNRTATLRMLAMTDCCMVSCDMANQAVESVFYSYEDAFKSINSVQLTMFGGIYPVGLKIRIWGRK